MSEVHGRSSDRFAPLVDVLARQLDSGADLGASLAVNIDGEMVVDLWGGWADEARTVPWAENTITNVFSTTKTMTALAALVLVDRGELDLDAPVAKYWPEFAANGKEGIKVRHLLSHTSGVSGWDAAGHPRGPVRLGQVDRPAGRPGALVGAGHGLGLPRAELRPPDRRSDPAHHRPALWASSSPTRSPGRWAPTSTSASRRRRFHRVADVVPPPPLDDRPRGAIDPNSVAFKTLTGPTIDAGRRPTPRLAAGRHRRGQRPRQCPLGGAPPVGGGLRRRGRWRPAALPADDRPDLRRAEQRDRPRARASRCGSASVTGCPDAERCPTSPTRQVCFWGGWGGSMMIIDVDRRMTFAYVMNKMAAGLLGNPSADALITATYACV